MKRLVLFSVILFVLLCFCGCLSSEETTVTPEEGSLLTTILKLGEPQDAILLQTTDTAVLIDTGITANAASVVRHLSRIGVTKLDALIITHFDQDHVGGADAVLSAVTVDKIYMPNYAVDTPEYNAFVAAMDSCGISPQIVSEDVSFTLDSVLFEINPTQKEVKEGEDNNHSLITTVTYGDSRLLFMGDAENARIKEFTKTNPAPVDFIKMPHHGKYHKPIKDFLDLVTPAYSCITSSNQERAEEKTLEELKERNITNYNIQSGNVYVSTDGTTLTVWQE